MAQVSRLLHYFHRKKQNLFNSSIERLAYIAGIASPIVTLPQLIQIWTTRDASGVSLITWFSYLVIVIIMTLYGIIHKEKPLIIMYGSLIIVDSLIIIGTIIY